MAHCSPTGYLRRNPPALALAVKGPNHSKEEYHGELYKPGASAIGSISKGQDSVS
jgi:hypothetical protein